MSEVITASDIYWITRLDAARILFILTAVASLAGSVVCLICAMIHGDIRVTCPSMYSGVPDARPGYYRCVKWLLPLAFFGGLVKEAVAIVVVPCIANNQDVQGLGSDVVGLAREWLDELRPKKADPK